MTDPVNVDDRSLTLRQFCAAEGICLASYFAMRRRGYAPVELRIPGSRIIRITHEARRNWHQMLAAREQSDAARLEAARQREQSIAAGKAAAKSPLHISAKRRRTALGRVTP
jgi:hypothetical protein